MSKKRISNLYKHAGDRSYTYIMSKQGRSLKGVPAKRITSFEQGNTSAKDNFKYIHSLKVLDNLAISDAVLEATRVAINRHLSANINRVNYALKIVPYPHQILRYHRMASGAGADRISQGMRLAFGDPLGRAAKMSYNQSIVEVRFDTLTYSKIVKDSLKKGAYKLPCKSKII